MDIKTLRAKAQQQKYEQDFLASMNRATVLKAEEEMEALSFVRSLENRLLEITSTVMLDAETQDKLVILILVNGLNACSKERQEECILQLLGKSLPSCITTPFALNYKKLNISGFKANVPKDLHKPMIAACSQSSELMLQLILKPYFNFMPNDGKHKIFNGFFFEVHDFRIPIVKPII